MLHADTCTREEQIRIRNQFVLLRSTSAVDQGVELRNHTVTRNTRAEQQRSCVTVEHYVAGSSESLIYGTLKTLMSVEED